MWIGPKIKVWRHLAGASRGPQRAAADAGAAPAGAAIVTKTKQA